MGQYLYVLHNQINLAFLCVYSHFISRFIKGFVEEGATALSLSRFCRLLSQPDPMPLKTAGSRRKLTYTL
jgi:hypothetical protein